MGREANARQRRFAELYVSSGNGSQAAQEAGYKGSRTALSVTAHRLLKQEKVLAIVRERQEQARVGALASTQAKRERLWRIAEYASELIEVQRHEEQTIGQDGHSIRTVQVAVTFRNPKAAIEAIRELNRMDGDYKEPGQAGEGGLMETLKWFHSQRRK